MRIIAGKFKGRNLKKFEIPSTRPTSDLIRGAVFNAIGDGILNANFLDLFAGSGAMGIEAISRGAKKSYFCDQNKNCITLIKDNLSLLNVDNFELFCGDCLKALIKFKNNNVSFDVIYIDPPYMSSYAEKSLKFIVENELLNDNGLLFWEHDISKLGIIEKTNIQTTKRYGSKYVTKLNKESLNALAECINMQNIK